MTEVIVDTNVAVVANMQNPQVVQSCIDACAVFMAEVVAQHVVLLDDEDAIRQEYAGALLMPRPHPLGAQFLVLLLQQQYNPARVRRVSLPRNAAGEFVDFPAAPELAGFDPSDRKFAALARKTGVAVTNAADSDWADNLTALNANGIAVDFLCGCDKTKWFTT